MVKRVYAVILVLCMLVTLLTACGRKERAFQGTITDITDNIVTMTPDPVNERLYTVFGTSAGK